MEEKKKTIKFKKTYICTERWNTGQTDSVSNSLPLKKDGDQRKEGG